MTERLYVDFSDLFGRLAKELIFEEAEEANWLEHADLHQSDLASQF
jgi:hypothetical protein